MKTIGKKPKNKVVSGISAFVLLWVLTLSALFSIVYFSGNMPEYVKNFTGDAIAAVLTTVDSGANQENGLEIFASSTSFISIPEIGLVSPILYPTSTDFDVLDKALLSGVVHYPKSALPGEDGNVYIFGHSTSKLIVRNPAFTAFSNIHKLAVGDIIYILFRNAEYRYRVTKVTNNVSPEEAKKIAVGDTAKLTLSTCWPPGNVKNRTIVEAEYLGNSATK